MRAIISDNHVRVLLLAGRIAEAREIANELCESSADLPGIAPLLSAAVAGRAALGAGNLDIACSQLRPAAELLSGSGAPAGVGYVYRLSYAIALAQRGLADQAANVLDALVKVRDASRSYLDYESALARAFVAAAQGCVTEAVGISLSQAEKARHEGQFATEVILLQTATQFGDISAAARLHELAAIVEGPRVAIAARFAAALADYDGTELSAISNEFESMGDIVAAMDTAAHAAAAFRRADMNGSALTCSARAEQLARRCGGASSPALLKASKPLPLTDRELEVATMIAQGLSTRLIAERLTLSVRTVEGHVYRAMAKTGAEDRDQLARMVPREGR
jgi:DNA-binding CsgD family transcriptional regulator